MGISEYIPFDDNRIQLAVFQLEREKLIVVKNGSVSIA